jgi:hypothetical protein
MARGRMSESDLAAGHSELRRRLARRVAWIDRIPYFPTRRACEPGTLLLERAPPSRPPESAAVPLIGDSESEVVGGLAIGGRTVLLSRDEEALSPEDGRSPFAASGRPAK